MTCPVEARASAYVVCRRVVQRIEGWDSVRVYTGSYQADDIRHTPPVGGTTSDPSALSNAIPLDVTLAAMLGPVIGPFADYVGYRRMLVIGLLTVLASALAIGFASNYSLLLLAALVGAGGRAEVLPVAAGAGAVRAVR
jgi:MFS family permease